MGGKGVVVFIAFVFNVFMRAASIFDSLLRCPCALLPSFAIEWGASLKWSKN